MNSKMMPEFPEVVPSREYEIRVKGHLIDLDWSGWFGDMTVLQDNCTGETIIQGKVLDTAELYGLITRLRNLGLPLISVIPLNKGKS